MHHEVANAGGNGSNTRILYISGESAATGAMETPPPLSDTLSLDSLQDMIGQLERQLEAIEGARNEDEYGNQVGFYPGRRRLDRNDSPETVQAERKLLSALPWRSTRAAGMILLTAWAIGAAGSIGDLWNAGDLPEPIRPPDHG